MRDGHMTQCEQSIQKKKKGNPKRERNEETINEGVREEKRERERKRNKNFTSL